ncbi:MAG: hypothetical protein HKM04_06535 [Legionellales bacterium]|nr:hypothetical protein [Legionellales bacterium]
MEKEAKGIFLDKLIIQFAIDDANHEKTISQLNDDQVFLELSEENNYYSFFKKHYANFMSNQFIDNKIMAICDKITPNQAENNILIEDSPFDIYPHENSFSHYLEKTIQSILFYGASVPYTLNSIKVFIESLQSPEQEETRIQFIQTLCAMYQADANKPRPASNDNTDSLFLELVKCKNFTFFLNNYLPLKDDNIHSPIYTRIGIAYPANMNIENGEFPQIAVTKSTKPIVAHKNEIIEEENVSFYQLLVKIAQEISQTNVTNMDELVGLLNGFTSEKKTAFLRALVTAWSQIPQEDVARFNQDEDADFLKKTGKNNYNLFLRECFHEEANGLDKFLFTQIGLVTVSQESYEQYGIKPVSLNNSNANINGVSNNIVAVNKPQMTVSKLNVVVNNNNNNIIGHAKNLFVGIFSKTPKLTPFQNYQRFEFDKKDLNFAVRSFVFYRVLCKDPAQNLSLISTGENIAIAATKAILGHFILPVKAGFFIKNQVDNACGYFENQSIGAQYRKFFDEIGDEALNKAITKTIDRFELIMKQHLEQFINADYKKLVRYLINHMTVAFDAINYALLASNNEFATDWAAYSKEEKILQIEKSLCYAVFHPFEKLHENEVVTVLNGKAKEQYHLESLMKKAPLKLVGNENLYRRVANDELTPGFKNYKGPVFDGEVYQAAMKGEDYVVPHVVRNDM